MRDLGLERPLSQAATTCAPSEKELPASEAVIGLRDRDVAKRPRLTRPLHHYLIDIKLRSEAGAQMQLETAGGQLARRFPEVPVSHTGIEPREIGAVEQIKHFASRLDS